MTTLHYSSHNEIRPGDKVECADGMEGEVVFTLTPGKTRLSDFLCRGFLVRKSDGALVHYQPSNTSVRLLSRVRRRSSKTMSATIRKEKFLQLLEDLGSHFLHYPEPLAKHLADCGIATVITSDGKGIFL